MANSDLSSFDFVFKVLVVGDSNVGKTSLIHRYCDKQFEREYLATIGVDVKTADVLVGSTRCRLQIWDTAGQERYRTIVPTFYRGCHGVIITYDITRPESFEHVAGWIKSVDERVMDSSVILMVIGTKTDLEEKRQVSRSDGENLAAEYRVAFAETSALLNQNVDKYV